MEPILRIAALLGLVKVLDITEKPLISAGAYTLFCLIIYLAALPLNKIFGLTVLMLLITFGLSFGYFWVLSKTKGTALWWVILFLGLLIGLL